MLLNFYLKNKKPYNIKLNKKAIAKFVYFCYLIKHKKWPLKVIMIDKNTMYKLNVYNRMVGMANNSSLTADQIDLTFWTYLHENFYFSKFFKTNTILKNINAHSILPSSIIPYMMYASTAVNWRRYKIIHSNEIVEILFISLWLKNTNMFMRWVRKFFEKNDLKKHKKLFLLMNRLLGSFIWSFNIFLKLKGIRFVMRGKFGKAGSVRKSRRYIKRGKCTSTSKNVAMTSQTKVIRTLTGVFSLKLELFF